MIHFYKELADCLAQGPVLAATGLAGCLAGEKAIWRGDTLLYCKEEKRPLWMRMQSEPQFLAGGAGAVYVKGEESFFLEEMAAAPEVVICGGGHISLELAALADYLEYPYTVLDDREEFCNEKRFPKAAACICGPFEESLKQLQKQCGNTYYVIVTRGHQADLACLEVILSGYYGYVGMIGSRTKVARSMDTLRKKGFGETVLQSIHAPIGLPIGGQTPKEISVSIVAELIAEKNRKKPASYLERDLIPRILEEDHSVLVTIIEKEGSAPRGTGSRMLVGENGILTGTIGGGMIEYQAEQDAVRMLQSFGETPMQTKHYQVNTNSAASLGMWCGGEVTVMFERLDRKE